MNVFSRRFLPLLLILLTGCGLATRVRPVPHGALAPELSVGGPAILQGVPIPLPLATVGGAYGFAPGFDVSAHTHLTTLVYKLAGFDIGLSTLLLENQGARPALTLAARGYAFTDFRSSVLPYFEGAITSSWDVGRFRPYVMLAGQFAIASRTFGWGLGLGTELTLRRVTLQLELRWYDPTRDVRHAAVEYLSPFKHGALGLQLSARYDFFPFTAEVEPSP